MALTKISRSLLDTGVSDSSDATAITISSSEQVMIGTTDAGYPDYGDSLTLGDVDGGGGNAGMTIRSGTSSYGTFYFSDATGTAAGTYAGKMQYNHSTNSMIFGTNSSDRLTIDSSGNVAIGTTTINTGTLGTSNTFLEVAAGTNSGSGTIILSRTTTGNDNEVGGLRFVNSDNADDDGLDSDGKLIAAISARSVTSDSNAGDDSGANLLFYTKPEAGNYAERIRIDSSGNLLVGKTSLDNSTIGTEIKFNGGLINVTNSAAQCMTINRLSSDGMLVFFQQDTNGEGSIQVSGSTVSYNGFSGNHESSGIASDTAKGTVCSTIDELDTYVSGTKEGQTRTDHAKIKVSDTVGDARVYGVLSSYSETDNKPIVASVGIGSVLVTGSCEGGDLLESNGDGTAKVQDDDIIKSKTIGKVTIGNSDTNVKLVSCVLYCG